MRALCGVVLGLVASDVLAQRIGVAPFSGPNAAQVRNQLVSAICDTADCVNSARVTTGNKPDWKKAKKEAVQFFVTGAVTKKGKALTLTLEVLNKPGAPKLRKTFPLAGDGLAAKTLQQAIDALKGAFGGAQGPAEADETPPPPKPEPKAAEPRPASAATSTTAPPRREEPVEPKSEEPAAEPKPERRVPFIAAEVGLDLLNRSFAYVQPVTNLRRYGLPLFPMASARLEFYPGALSSQSLLGGLGVEVGVGFAPWLRSRRESAMDDVYPTSTLRFDGGLSWRLMPVKTLHLAFIPLLGVRYHAFTVGPNASGVRLDLLPNLAYVGLKAGLGFEVGLVGDVLVLFGRFAVVPVFSSGEIISADFFPRGSNFGLDAQAGLGVRLFGPLSVRAAFDFMRYGLTFRTEPTDAFVAQGAVDQYLGGTVALRFAY